MGRGCDSIAQKYPEVAMATCLFGNSDVPLALNRTDPYSTTPNHNGSLYRYDCWGASAGKPISGNFCIETRYVLASETIIQSRNENARSWDMRRRPDSMANRISAAWSRHFVPPDV